MRDDRPADDVRGVKDQPDKPGTDTESPEQMMARHEELHREHRSRLDEHDEHVDEHHDRLAALEKHCGLRTEERAREERGDERDRTRDPMRQRRRHD